MKIHSLKVLGYSCFSYTTMESVNPPATTRLSRWEWWEWWTDRNPVQQ